MFSVTMATNYLTLRAQPQNNGKYYPTVTMETRMRRRQIMTQKDTHTKLRAKAIPKTKIVFTEK